MTAWRNIDISSYHQRNDVMAAWRISDGGGGGIRKRRVALNNGDIGSVTSAAYRNGSNQQ